MIQADKDLHYLLLNNKELNRWVDSPDLRKQDKEIFYERRNSNFSIEYYYELIKDNSVLTNAEVKILFASFSPFLHESEGYGLPVYAKKTLPNSTVDMMYIKGEHDLKYNVSHQSISHTQKLQNKYDLIIGRSSIFNLMRNRKDLKKILRKSHTKINVKTMSLESNYKYSDYLFDEEDFCSPGSPILRNKASQFLKENIKKNWILLSGSLWYVKNQLSFLEKLDARLLQNYKLIIAGNLKDESYIEKIINTCNEKQLEYLFIGEVCPELMFEINCLSKISIISMDMRSFGQPKGYPRTIGENLSAQTLPVCYYPVTVPTYYKNSVLQYEDNNLNEILSEGIKMVEDKNFQSHHNWGDITFEDFCRNSLEKCFEIAGIS